MEITGTVPGTNGSRNDPIWRKILRKKTELQPLNSMTSYLVPVRTMLEQKTEPYPNTVDISCFITMDEDTEPLEETSNSGEPIYEFEYWDNLYETSENAHLCEVLERNTREDYAILKDSVAPPLHKQVQCSGTLSQKQTLGGGPRCSPTILR